MIRLRARGNSPSVLHSIRREIIQITQWVDTPIQTDPQHEPHVFYCTRRGCSPSGWLPSVQVGPIQELGQAQLPLRGLQRDLLEHWHCREQPGPNLPALHPARTEGWHRVSTPGSLPFSGIRSCSDISICSHSKVTFGSFVCRVLCPSCSPAVLKSSQNGNHYWCKNSG